MEVRWQQGWLAFAISPKRIDTHGNLNAMTDRASPEDMPEQMTLAEIRSLQAENARVIAELTAAQQQAGRTVERLFAAVEELRREQNRTSNDVSTLKGWGLENLCERRPELFANAFELRSVEVISKDQIVEIARAAHDLGIINADQRASVTSADLYLYGRSNSDDSPICLIVQVSFVVQVRDVRRAFDQSGILNEIIQQYQPRYINGRVVPVVSGTEIDPDTSYLAAELGVTYVAIQNGNQLTNPPE